MGPDFRVLVRKSRKQAEQYHRLYKVLYDGIMYSFLLFTIVLLPIFHSLSKEKDFRLTS